MNDIEIHKIGSGVDVSKAPAGKFCEIVEADEQWKIGCICILPFCTNQALVILNRNIASTDKYAGVKKVKPMQSGDSFTVTVA